jgi:hypothetical protein
VSLKRLGSAVRRGSEDTGVSVSARAIAELCVGDRVMFTNRIRPRYLEHELAEVTEVDDRTVTVRLWRPVGRFGDRELRCPPLALRKLDHGTSIRHS